tara:strand:- start:33 stop:617 length:585 start_codon:yes stop_codon:yes gene_type:complete
MSINSVIISESIQSQALLETVLKPSDYEVVYTASSLPALLAETDLQQPELIIISIDTPSANLIKQLQVINKQYPLPVVVFAKNDSEDAIEQFIQAGVSAYVVDGLNPHRVLAILKTALVRFEQQSHVQQELHSLKTNLADRKIIDRAKGIIMTQRQCSEDEAYTLLRTNAMTQNIRLAALAKNIVDTVNLWKNA